jgi:AcrR family transcriptional regulator
MTATQDPLSASSASRRDRKRYEAMRRVQQRAVELFTARGFGAVTVEEIAEVADVSPVSVYRWFGTKEGLVLWDEYDPGIFAVLARRLADQEPLDAVRDAILGELDEVYDADRGLVLARTQLIHREPALLAASMLNLRRMQAALADTFDAADAGGDGYTRAVLAGVATAVLAAAVDAWQAEDGRTPLAEFVTVGFAALEDAR